MKIPLSYPDITNDEIEAVTAVLKTPQLSLGAKLFEFERAFAEFVGTRRAIAVNSGTSGLHLVVRAMGIGDGDEVITTPFSFIASANCLLFERAKPVFVDIRPDTLNIDENLIEARITPKTKAILAVHVFGYPSNMKKIRQIAQKYRLAVIEDACEAIGARIDRRNVGTFGQAAVFAFYPNKQMTTGEGGMIVTDSRRIADLCRSMRNQGRDESRGGWLEHNRLGFNYRLSDIHSALGLVQIKRIKELLSKREKVAQAYERAFQLMEEIDLPLMTGEKIVRSWFVYVIQLKGCGESRRNEVIRLMRKKGVGCSVYFPPIHTQPFYRRMFGYKKGDFSVAESIAARTIALPFFGNLKEKQIDYVVRSLKKSLREVK